MTNLTAEMKVWWPLFKSLHQSTKVLSVFLKDITYETFCLFFLQKLNLIIRALYFCIFYQIIYCGPNQDRHILCTLFVLHLLCSHGALCSRSVRQLTAHLVRILSITFTRALKNNWIMGQNYFWSCILQFMFEGQGFHVSSWGLPEGFPRASLGLPEGLLRASWGVLQGFLGLPRGLPEGSLMISWGHWGCPEGFQRASRGLSLVPSLTVYTLCNSQVDTVLLLKYFNRLFASVPSMSHSFKARCPKEALKESSGSPQATHQDVFIAPSGGPQ